MTTADCRPSCVAAAESVAESSPTSALEAIEPCLTCSTASPSVFLLAADLYGAIDDNPAAARVLREGTARFPSSPAMWESLSRVELALGRPAEAVDAIATAAKLRPQDERLAGAYRALIVRHGSEAARATAAVDALILEASGRYELGDVAGAKQTLQAALDAAGRHPPLAAKVRLRMGLVSLAQRRLSEARTAFATARRGAKNDTALLGEIDLARAELELAAGRYAAAESVAAAAVAARPRDPLGHVNLAVARAHRRNADGAVQALAKAFEQGLSSRMTRDALQALLADLPFGPRRQDVDAMIRREWTVGQR